MASLSIILLLCILSLSHSKYLVTNNFQNKLGSTPYCIPPNNNNSTVISMGDCEYNVLYSVGLALGSNSQYFYFQFDTGSNTLWIPLIATNSSGFNNTKSTSFQSTSQQNSIPYGDGSSVSGFMCYDKLTVPNTTISVTLKFLCVQDNQSPMPANIMGLVGMGYTSQPNFLDLAYQQNQIQTNQFILSLAGNSAPSYLYYDDLPQSIVNNMQYSSVEGQGYWQLSINTLTTNNNQYSEYAPQFAVIDSGTTVIALPQQLALVMIENEFPNCGFTQPPNSAFICPYCPQQLGGSVQMPTIAITFSSGVEVYLPPISYAQVYSEGYCKLLFTVIDQPLLILGDVFFRQYNVSFSKINNQIGFQGNTQNVSFNNINIFIYGEYILLGIIIIVLIYGIFVILFTCPRCYQVTQQTSSKNVNQQQFYYTQQLQPNIYYPNNYKNQQQMYNNLKYELRSQ